MSTAIVGVDIGSRSCCVCVAKKGGVEAVLDELSERRTASCVAFTNKTRFTGSSAMTQLVTNPKNTVFNFIPFIGKKFGDNTVQTQLPYTHYKILEDSKSIYIEVNFLDKVFRFKPEQILAMLIKKLKHMAENDLLLPVTQAVVNVPSAYTDIERRCVLTALNVAGIECICLLNDLTSVSILYHSTRLQSLQQSKVIAFADIGYSNFQTSVVRFESDKIQVLQSAFDSSLGGREFDRVIFNYLSKQFVQKYSVDVMDSAKASLRLMTECEKVKKRLSANAAEFEVHIDCLMNDKDVSAKIDRKLFDNLSDSLLKRINGTIVNMLQVYRMIYKEPISSVEIVGGTSRIPSVKQVINECFKLEPQNTLNADEAVARGCTLQCAMMNTNCMMKRIIFLDCVPYGISLDTFTGIKLDLLLSYDSEKKTALRQQSVTIVSGSQPYPLKNSVEFVFNDCSIIEIKYNDINEVPNDNKIIGYIVINNESTNLEKSSKMLLEYSINIHGIFAINNLLFPKNSKLPSQNVPNVPESPTPFNKRKGARSQKPTDLYEPMDFQVYYEMSCNSQMLSELRKQELDFEAIDKKETDRLNVKNRLEESIYKYRDIISNATVPLKDNENLMRTIQEIENWLQDEGEDEEKEKYEEHLTTLNNLIKTNKTKRNMNKNESNVIFQNTVKETEDVLFDSSQLDNNNNNKEKSSKCMISKLISDAKEYKLVLKNKNKEISRLLWERSNE